MKKYLHVRAFFVGSMMVAVIAVTGAMSIALSHASDYLVRCECHCGNSIDRSMVIDPYKGQNCSDFNGQGCAELIVGAIFGNVIGTKPNVYSDCDIYETPSPSPSPQIVYSPTPSDSPVPSGSPSPTSSPRI